MLDTWTDKYSLPFNIKISNRTKHHFKIYNSQIEMCHFTVVLLLKKKNNSLCLVRIFQKYQNSGTKLFDLATNHY